MNKKVYKLLPGIIAIAAAGIIFCWKGVPDSGMEVSLAGEDTNADNLEIETYVWETSFQMEETEEGIWVYVYGCVEHPGVYYLDKDARAFEAIDMAGGMNENAVTGYVNLAMVLEDGQQIYVPDKSEAEESSELFSVDETDSLININNASISELMTLPGIGAAKAEAIIKYREQQPFQSIDDIMNVSGIKGSVFEKIRDLIKV